MAKVLYVGNFTKPLKDTPIREIRSREEVETIIEGEIIRRWDYVMEADSESLRPSQLEPIRHRSDNLADDLIEYLEPKAGQDCFELLLEALNKEEVDERVTKFWEQINLEPPSSVTGLAELVGDQKVRNLEEFRPSKKNDRSAPPSLSNGQAVFKRYAAPIFIALLHFSLAGGFSSPKLAAVMNETNYLTSASRDATYRRLLETNLMVLDAMNGLEIGGVGWKSVVRVRLLHAQVRRRIKMGKGKFNVYDEKESGIPINQADLCAVLGSFAVAPIWSMERSGIYLNDAEKSAYQAAWRHIGYYIGIDVDLLERFYGGSWSQTQKSFACMAFDIFPEEIPLDGSKTSTFRILSAVSGRPPTNNPVEYHLEYSRRLLGDRLSNQLALPRGTLSHRIRVEFDIYSSLYLIKFGQYYRSSWELERQTLFSEIIEILVIWQLGVRRTKFAWRNEIDHSKVLTEEEGEAAGIVMGVEAGLRVKKRWMWLLVEMIGVSVGVFGGIGISGIVGFVWVKNKIGW